MMEEEEVDAIRDRWLRGYTGKILWQQWVRSPLRRARRYLQQRAHQLCVPWIHTPDDGRAMPRSCYVNGQKVERVFYADLRQGFVRYHVGEDRARMNRRKDAVRWAKKRGAVDIQFEDGTLV